MTVNNRNFYTSVQINPISPHIQAATVVGNTSAQMMIVVRCRIEGKPAPVNLGVDFGQPAEFATFCLLR